MENKFKVWCVNNNEWEKHDTVITNNGKLFQIDDRNGRLIPLSEETHIIVYPTEVKDINKKECHLGDILKSERTGRLYIINYKNGAFIISYKNSNIELLYDYATNGELEVFKIVGNIFENEDMIKKEG